MFLSENDIKKIEMHPGIKEDLMLSICLLRKID